MSAIVFASDLAEEDDWASGNTTRTNGLTVFTQTVYSGSTIAGTYSLLLVHNSSNHVGAYWFWEGEAGGTSATITAELRVTFTPSDTPQDIQISNNRRASLWATSSALPTSTFNANQEINVTWTLAAGSPLTLSGSRLRWPHVRPAQIKNCMGYWFVLEKAGVEVYETLENWERRDDTSLFWSPNSRGANRGFFRVGDDGVGYLYNTNANNTPDANSVLKIYGAI